jgi:Amt family ammonium transporter
VRSGQILIKNLLDVSIATILWFVVGYGVAYGSGEGNFMGASNFAGSTDDNYARDWLFQWAFAGTAATIVSGCLAERC